MAWSRTKTSQPATGAPRLVAVPSISGATEILSPGDYSVPDPSREWEDFRDPDDGDRRIQPGQLLVETPLFLHNTNPEDDDGQNAVTVDLYVILQDGTRIDQIRVSIPGGDTYTHNMPGQVFRKTGLAKESGDRLFVKPSVNGVIDLSVGISEGALEQNQPLQGSPSFVVETG